MPNAAEDGLEGSAAKGPAGAPSSVKLVVELGPLVLFFLANARPKLFEPLVAPFLPESALRGENAGLFTATLVLMAGVVAALVFSWLSTRRLAVMPLVTAVLVVVLGVLTFYLQDPVFIKMKPTVLYVLFAAALYAGLLFKRPLLPIIFDQALDLTERGWRLLTWRWIGCFLVLAAANEAVWRTQSNDVWVAFKFPGIFIFLMIFSLAQVPLILRHRAHEAQPAAAASTEGVNPSG
jgi:intracellular septation protein